jgi:hypothetical protein
MDLDAYISRYSGETRLQRLLLVAKASRNQDTGVQALKLAEQQLKADGNVQLYKAIFGRGDGNWNSLYHPNQAEAQGQPDDEHPMGK